MVSFDFQHFKVKTINILNREVHEDQELNILLSYEVMN